jgi:N-acyl-L-homoserine lactone synthetase
MIFSTQLEATMQTTTLSFDNLHNHGTLFTNVLRARHESFIVHRKWDLPQYQGMEFDQYDTPQSRWIAVHEFGQVLAGIRLTPTTAACGIYSYMIRDAQNGLLGSIPQDLMYEEAPVADHIWETSRIFIAHHVPASKRGEIQRDLMAEMVRSAAKSGATQLLGLCPSVWSRWMRRIGYECVEAGPKMTIEGASNTVVKMSLANTLN